MVIVNAEQLFRFESRLTRIMRQARRDATAMLTLSLVGAQVLTLHGQVAPDLVSPASVIHEYVSAAAAIPEHAVIPPNLEISSPYRGLVANMLRQSPTFRRQILRIAGAADLTVRLQWVPAPWLGGARAITQFSRESTGHLSANVSIVRQEKDVELIAHEMEHIIEQLDDVDLRAKAGQPDSGVRAFEGTRVFETNRATRMGVQVAQEVR